nr:H235 [uncultured bacterium]
MNFAGPTTLQDDQKRILQGLASIVDGVGAYRTHIGSAPIAKMSIVDYNIDI